eukprot:1219019-Rhodomonas_salina.1
MRVQGGLQAIAAAKRARVETEKEVDAMQRRAQSAMQTVAWQASVLATAEQGLEKWKKAVSYTHLRAHETEADL